MTEKRAEKSLTPSSKKKHICTSQRRQGVRLGKKASDLAKERFLASIAKDGIVLNACKAAGIDRSTVRYWEEHDPEFSMRYTLAREDANDKLRDMIIKRAKKSDLLLMFHAKARMPEYRDKQQVEVSGSITFATVWGGGSIEEEEAQDGSSS